VYIHVNIYMHVYIYLYRPLSLVYTHTHIHTHTILAMLASATNADEWALHSTYLLCAYICIHMCVYTYKYIYACTYIPLSPCLSRIHTHTHTILAILASATNADERALDAIYSLAWSPKDKWSCAALRLSSIYIIIYI